MKALDLRRDKRRDEGLTDASMGILLHSNLIITHRHCGQTHTHTGLPTFHHLLFHDSSIRLYRTTHDEPFYLLLNPVINGCYVTLGLNYKHNIFETTAKVDYE